MDIRLNREHCELIDLEELPGGPDLYEELADIFIRALEVPSEVKPPRPKEER